MTVRRGFTLIELLVAIVITGMLGVTIVRMIQASQRVSRAQVQQVDLQSDVRAAALAIPSELREIGYDSNSANPTPSAAVSTDLVTLGANSITFDAARGFGLICGTPTLTEIKLARPLYGLREPRVGDRFLLFVENDDNTGLDDLWLPITVTSIDYGNSCPGIAAIRLTYVTPATFPGGPTLAVSNLKLNSPVRYYEQMQYALMTAGGRSWLGARSVATEPNLAPVLGPLAPGNGFGLRYFTGNGTEIAPGGNPTLVRLIRVTVNGESDGLINLAGASQTQMATYQLVTEVALRNTLRP